MKLLFILPVALGDAVCASASLVALKAHRPDSLIDVCCHKNMVDVFSDLKEIRDVFQHPELSDNFPDEVYDWIIDCASEPFSIDLIKRFTFQNWIGHEPTDPSIHVINGTSVDPRITIGYLSFFEYPEQPAWHLEASLVSSMLNKPLAEWACRGFEPTFNCRTDHGSFLDNDDSETDILFIPCGSNSLKRWPDGHWIHLLNSFSREKYRVGMIAGPAEIDSYPHLSTHSNIKIYSEISLRKIAALCARASLVIANDCGPMHIAAASGANLLAIFGPTNPRCWFAYSGSHRKYIQKGTGANKLGILAGLTTWDEWPTPDDVWMTAGDMIGGQERQARPILIKQDKGTQR